MDRLQLAPEVLSAEARRKQLRRNPPMKLDHQPTFVARELKVVLSRNQELRLPWVEPSGEAITARRETLPRPLDIRWPHHDVEIHRLTQSEIVIRNQPEHGPFEGKALY